MNNSNVYPFFSGPKPRVIGHRGAAGEAPENTLISFARAIEDGATIVELDVRANRDGEAVILHDAGLRRTTNGRGRVRRRRLEDLKALDAGYRFTPNGGASYPYRGRKIEIPTLEEFFSACPNVRSIVEIKPSRLSIVKQVVESVSQAGKEGQVLLATEDDRIMKAIRAELRERGLKIATGFSYAEVAAFIKWTRRQGGAFVPPGQALQIPPTYRGMTLVSQRTVRAAHEVGVELFVWTVNEADEMERLLGLGVDGIITDYPARLRRLLASR